jgi:hypothetical protein
LWQATFTLLPPPLALPQFTTLQASDVPEYAVTCTLEPVDFNPGMVAV